MRQSIIFCVLVATFMAVNAFPSVEVPGQEETVLGFEGMENPSDYNVDAPVESYRVKRATCDLMSGLGWNHAPCAAHCLVLGKKGGYCNGQGVCVCRN